VPEAIEQVLTGCETVYDANKVTSSLRLRYFSPRDLVSNGTFRSGETLLNLHVGYQISKHRHLALTCSTCLTAATRTSTPVSLSGEVLNGQ
jgi:hypothetical protein